MAVSPKEVALTEEELGLAKDLEQQMDKALAAEFVTGKPTVLNLGSVSVKNQRADYMSDRVINEVVRRYQAAGWIVKREYFGFNEKKIVFTPAK